jgi:hypothetical protein
MLRKGVLLREGRFLRGRQRIRQKTTTMKNVIHFNQKSDRRPAQ